MEIIKDCKNEIIHSDELLLSINGCLDFRRLWIIYNELDSVNKFKVEIRLWFGCDSVDRLAWYIVDFFSLPNMSTSEHLVIRVRLFCKNTQDKAKCQFNHLASCNGNARRLPNFSTLTIRYIIFFINQYHKITPRWTHHCGWITKVTCFVNFETKTGQFKGHSTNCHIIWLI